MRLNGLLYFSLFVTFLLSGSYTAPADEITGYEDLYITFATSCFVCHSSDDPAAGLDLAQYESFEDMKSDLSTWIDVKNRIADREMPPQNALPLEDEQRESIVNWLDQTIKEEACGDGIDPGPAVVRRLNKNEYAATVRDLLGIQFNAGGNLPADGAGGEGFDNAAETLFISPVHGERYLEAAREALDYAAKDTQAREQIFITTPDDDTTEYEAAREIVKTFASRAYRRPVKPSELDRLMVLYHAAKERGETFEQSVFYAFQAILISPNFLFISEEPNQDDMVRPIDDYELASRLSYFLWTSMPDDELIRLAAENKLHRQDVLKQQLERMLNEPKFERLRGRSNINLEDRKFHEFVKHFISQWLGTRELGISAKPDEDLFPRYNETMQSAMIHEPIFVMQHIIFNDLSLLDLIDSNYTYMSRQMAHHYDLDDEVEVPNSQLNYVELPKSSSRGGLLTMAGPLTVSSFPNRTSPVLRGKWILETILGTPPPPPPPNVPELPENEDHSDPKTLRERLMQHRENPACASCHDRIDPLGFGLENFDPIGKWRDEEADQPIDASGQLPNGQEFEGPEQLKKVLMDKKDQFIRHLTKKMLGFALGRGLRIEDQCTVDHIVETLQANNYKAQVLLWEIIKSVPFRYHQANPPETVAIKNEME